MYIRIAREHGLSFKSAFKIINLHRYEVAKQTHFTLTIVQVLFSSIRLFKPRYSQ